MVITWLPRWTEYGLVIFMAWLVSGLLVAGSQPTIQPTVLLQTESGETSTMDMLFQNTSLFGQAKVQDKKVNQSVAVVASKLNIKLVGTVVAGKKSAAMVTLSGSKKQQVFFLHEEMQPGVRLKQV
ncbi:MAG: type II secretion system protein N, partial [Ghiorsea sp.]|nr:type II secretion system protein N [Ghiorsea sp.]